MSKEYLLSLSTRHDNLEYVIDVPATKNLKQYDPMIPFTTGQYRCGHPEQIETNARYIAFYERSGLVKANRRNAIHALVKKSPRKYQNYLLDHALCLRRPGERWPCLLLDQPYDLRDGHDELADTLGLKRKVFEPSSCSLWNPNTHMIFWWNPRYYQPDWEVLMVDTGIKAQTLAEWRKERFSCD